MPEILFRNYELNKLAIDAPGIANVAILLILIAVCILTGKRRESQFLDRVQSDQMKGLAISLVVLGHLWVHVSDVKTEIILSGDAIALFFIFSGYGLTLSNTNKDPRAAGYWASRLNRVMVPYWAATIVLLALDYFILNKSYAASDLIYTLFGINITLTTKYLDYVRWYITPLLLWYLLFWLFLKIFGRKNYISALIFSAGVIFFLDYYVAKFSWYQIFAFPLGCLLGKYHPQIAKIYNKTPQKFAIGGFVSILLVLSYKIAFSSSLPNLIPWIMYKFTNEVVSVIFSMGIILIIAFAGSKGYVSRFLLYAGSISYELFLLHGAFLIKYNPIISGTDTLRLSVEFAAFMLFAMVLASGFQRTLMVVK